MGRLDDLMAQRTAPSAPPAEGGRLASLMASREAPPSPALPAPDPEDADVANPFRTAVKGAWQHVVHPVDSFMERLKPDAPEDTNLDSIEGQGTEKLKTAPRRFADIAKSVIVNEDGKVSPGSLARGIVRRAPGGSTALFGVTEAGNLAKKLGDLTGSSTLQDVGADIHEAGSGHRWRTEKELQDLPNDQARRLRLEQMPALQATADNTLEMGQGMVELPFMAAKGTAAMAADVLDGRFKKAAARPLDMANAMLSDTAESLVRTATAGGVRNDDPLTSALDVASIIDPLAALGHAATTVRAAQVARAARAAKLAELKTAIAGEEHAAESLARAHAQEAGATTAPAAPAAPPSRFPTGSQEEIDRVAGDNTAMQRNLRQANRWDAGDAVDATATKGSPRARPSPQPGPLTPAAEGTRTIPPAGPTRIAPPEEFQAAAEERAAAKSAATRPVRQRTPVPTEPAAVAIEEQAATASMRPLPHPDASLAEMDTAIKQALDDVLAEGIVDKERTASVVERQRAAALQERLAALQDRRRSMPAFRERVAEENAGRARSATARQESEASTAATRPVDMPPAHMAPPRHPGNTVIMEADAAAADHYGAVKANAIDKGTWTKQAHARALEESAALHDRIITRAAAKHEALRAAGEADAIHDADVPGPHHEDYGAPPIKQPPSLQGPATLRGHPQPLSKHAPDTLVPGDIADLGPRGKVEEQPRVDRQAVTGKMPRPRTAAELAADEAAAAQLAETDRLNARPPRLQRLLAEHDALAYEHTGGAINARPRGRLADFLHNVATDGAQAAYDAKRGTVEALKGGIQGTPLEGIFSRKDATADEAHAARQMTQERADNAAGRPRVDVPAPAKPKRPSLHQEVADLEKAAHPEDLEVATRRARNRPKGNTEGNRAHNELNLRKGMLENLAKERAAKTPPIATAEVHEIPPAEEALQAKPWSSEDAAKQSVRAGAARADDIRHGVVRRMKELSGKEQGAAFRVLRQGERIQVQKYGLLKMARDGDEVKARTIAQSMEAGELHDLAQESGGALLVREMPDGSIRHMNTSLAALDALHDRVDILDEVKAGRMKFVPAIADNPAMQAAAKAANAHSLEAMAVIAETGKESARVGLIGPDAAAAGATSYVEGIYDGERSAGVKSIKPGKAPRDRAHFTMHDWEALLRTQDVDGVRMVHVPDVMFDQTKVPMYGMLAGKMMPVRDFLNIKRGVRRRPYANVADGFMRDAEAKYQDTISEGLARGRRSPEKFGQTLEDQLIGHSLANREHGLFALAAEHMGLKQLPVEAKAAGKVRLRLLSGRETVNTADIAGVKYAQVPTTTIERGLGKDVPQYGALAGRWVPMSTLENVERVTSYTRGYWSRCVAAWKQNKIVNNLASHFNNAHEIVTKNMLDGGGPHQLAMGARDVWKGAHGKAGPIYTAFEKAGLGGAAAHGQDGFLKQLASAKDFPQALFDVVKEKGKRHLVPEAAVRTYEGLTNLLSSLGTKNVNLRNSWHSMELVSRYTTFKRFVDRVARESGTAEDILLANPKFIDRAVEHVEDLHPDFSDIPKWAQVVRDLPLLGIPFVSYPVKATGIYSRLMWEKPNLMRSMVMGGREAYDRATPDEQKRRDLAPVYAQRGNTTLGSKDINATWLQHPKLVPFAMMDKPGGGNVESADDRNAWQKLTSTNGFGSGVVDAVKNRTAFFDRKVYEDGKPDDAHPGKHQPPEDPTSTKAAKIARHLLGTEGPGVVDNVLKKVVPALSGEVDARRGRKLSVGDALLSTMGLKIQDPNTAQAITNAKDKQDLALRDLATWWDTIPEKDRPRREADLERRRAAIFDAHAYDIGKKLH